MRKRALLIGINNYPDPYKLRGCIEDIHSLEAALKKNGDGSPNFDIKTLEDEKLSKNAISEIQRLFSDDSDVALLYFSGHGYVNTTGAEIVFPSNIASDDNYYTGIQMDDIMRIVNKSRVKNKIIILDCCHSGAMGKYDIRDDKSELQPGVSILTACREDEYAMEMDGHGVFTELLCDALNGGAADFSGNITIGGIYAYIDRSFGACEQRPVFNTNVTEFIPLKTIQPHVELQIIRELPSLFQTPDSDLHLDPSFEKSNDTSIKHEYKEPDARPDHIKQFAALQKLQSIGFVRPVNEEHMYFAAMNSRSCKLTALGKYYCRLVKNGRI